jgi:uncharacterized membrane protein YphA (DoxX/SURF4 family)
MRPQKSDFRIIRYTLALLFVFAGMAKLRDPNAFSDNLANYSIVPSRWLFPLAVTVPWLEILAGMSLFHSYWRRAGYWLLLILTVAFVGFTSTAYFKGMNIECGCFGPGNSTVNGWAVLRSLALAGASTLGLCVESKKKPARLV